MRNIIPYNENSFSFYDTVRSKKQDADLIERLEAMDGDIESFFRSYDRHFKNNSLEDMIANVFTAQQKSDLSTLYDYSSATLTKFRGQLTKTPSGRVMRCQNCTINNISTFDHFVPQGEFPEFAVHPKNLLCCCADCNPRRGNVWRLNGHRTTLNLYLDVLPDVQYLFVQTDIGKTDIETTFYLENRNGINNQLFQLLSDHYMRLNLFSRFSESSDTVITSLKAIVAPFRARHTLAETRDFVIETIRAEQIAFGHNYWQSVLKLELINNDDFLIDYE